MEVFASVPTPEEEALGRAAWMRGFERFAAGFLAAVGLETAAPDG